MKRMRKRTAVALAALTFTAFQGFPTGCAEFGAVTTLNLVDFCGVLNCQGGTFFNFCQPVALLVDCPTAQADDGG